MKINKFQIFLEAIQALTSEQQQSAIIEEFFDDILTVFTVCMEFVKIFSCMINYDAKTIIGKARRKAEVLAEKLGASNSLLTAEHSARNTIAGNISVNKLCDRRHGDLSSDSKNCTKSISDSSCQMFSNFSYYCHFYSYYQLLIWYSFCCLMIDPHVFDHKVC